MATITITTGQGSATQTISTGARGPQGPPGSDASVNSYVDDIATLGDYPTSFPTAPADINNVGGNKLIGRHSATPGAGQEIGIDGGLAFQGGNLKVDLATAASTWRTELGLGSVALLSSVSLTTNVTGTLPVANGGTGGTTATDARTNLGLGTADTPTFTEVRGVSSLILRALTGNNSRISISSSAINTILNSGFQTTFDGDGLWPVTTTQLGKSTNRWSTVWTTNANVSGTVTAGAMSLTTALPISSGGTGSSTASTARTALSASALSRHVVVGDSLSSTGSGSATTSWAAYWSRHQLNQPIAYTNLAIAGRTASEIDSAHASQVTPISPNTLGGVGVLFTLCGTNDLNAGTTDSALVTLLRSIWSKGRADGFKVCAFTITKNGLLDATKEARRVSVNATIRADSANWDYLVDLDALLPNNGDTTYFTGDNLHYSAAGGEFVARNVRQVLDGGIPYRANLAMARNVGTFSVPNGSVLTKIPYTTAETDRAALFGSGTITVKEAGVYCVIASIAPQNASASIRWIMELYKNGSSAYRMLDITSTDFMLQGCRLVSCAAGDTLEIYASQNHSGSITINNSSPASVFQVFKVNQFP